MKYEIKGTPLPVLICSLTEDESMITEKGAMSWMTSNIEMKTNVGGVGKMFSKALSGESIFQNIYTAKGSSGMIAFAASFPGQILPFEVSEEKSIIVQKSSFLASESNVNLSMFFQKKLGASLFGGEGFIMQKFTGKGIVFLEVAGSLVEYNLKEGQSMMVDTGCLVAMEPTISMDIKIVKGIGNKLFGGEGLFNTKVTGPGNIWLQSMPITKIAGNLMNHLSVK